MKKKSFLMLLCVAFALGIKAQEVDTTKKIVMNVSAGQAIKFAAYNAPQGTIIRVLSGEIDTIFEAMTQTSAPMESSMTKITAGADTMVIYGDITKFTCAKNKANLTGLNVKKMPTLIDLRCQDTHIAELDLSQNTELEYLDAYQTKLHDMSFVNNTKLQSIDLYQDSLMNTVTFGDNIALTYLDLGETGIDKLDISGCQNLQDLWCQYNKIDSIDVSKNTELTGLYLASNRLTYINMPTNTKLKTLHINDNMLKSLDINNKPALTQIYMWNNQFTTAGIDSIYCLLPTSSSSASIAPAKDETDTDVAKVIATNAQNAKDKNWNVVYYVDKAPINTTGNATCAGATDIFEINAENSISIFPNPAENFVVISKSDISEKPEQISIYNEIGQEIYSNTFQWQQTIDITSWNSGIYYIKIGNYSNKFIKQ